MSDTQVPVVRKSWRGSRRVALACAVLLAFAAAPLHGQFTYQDVYDFNCSTGGCEPVDYGQLMQGADGNLYGTAFTHGSNGGGTVFLVTPSSAYSDLWPFTFEPGPGCCPLGALTLASDGNFYGTTQIAGTFTYGTLFRFTPPGSLTVLHNFDNTDGEFPQVAPTQAKDGNLYGVTGSGTTYRVTLPSGTFKQLPNNAPGNAFGPLLLALDGYLYGTTSAGGTFNMGTIFRMTTGGAIKVLYNFSGADGDDPAGPLAQGSDGNLYGTTTFGGANNTGEIFQLTLPKHKLNVLHSFSSINPSNSENSDGASPLAGLLAASDGYLYGSSDLGGTNTCGTLFRVTTIGSFSKIAEFPNLGCGPSNGNFDTAPQAALTQHTNGCLYGVTESGGTNRVGNSYSGNVYSLCPATPYHTVKVEGPVWVKPEDKVTILGDSLSQVIQVTFAGVQAQFSPGSDTYLVAQVPSAAIDGTITVTLNTGLQVQSQGAVHILPGITNLDPSSGTVGTQVGIVGGGFAGAKKVTFGGVKATNFTVVSPTLIQAIVPTGAKTGKVTVTTPNGAANSKQTFTVN